MLSRLIMSPKLLDFKPSSARSDLSAQFSLESLAGKPTERYGETESKPQTIPIDVVQHKSRSILSLP